VMFMNSRMVAILYLDKQRNSFNRAWPMCQAVKQDDAQSEK
jgi:hypothetical protein